MAESRAVRRGGPRECKQLVDDLFASYPGYANLGVTETNTRPVASAIPFATETYERLFRRVLETRAFAFGDSVAGSTNGKATIVFGFPILDGNGPVQGLVFAALEPRFSLDLQSQLPKGATLTEVDRNGNILVRFPGGKDWSGQPLPETSVLKNVLSKRTGIAEDLDGEGVPAVYAFDSRRSQLYAGNVVTILTIAKHVLLDQADRAKVRRLGWLATASGVSIALGFALGWLASQPPTRT